jgi:hypothetical protein
MDRLTEKYCDECAGKLSLVDKSPQDVAFFKATLFREGTTPSYEQPMIDEDGICFKCGRKGYVMYYTR